VAQHTVGQWWTSGCCWSAVATTLKASEHGSHNLLQAGWRLKSNVMLLVIGLRCSVMQLSVSTITVKNRCPIIDRLCAIC